MSNSSLEVKVQQILEKAGIKLSRTELREEVRQFNLFQMPISTRLDMIIQSPAAFIRYLKNKEEHGHA